MNKGTVYWITGLAGAGKTTIGNLLYTKIKSNKANVVILDGDALRKVFGNDIGYTSEERKKGAYRNARICKMLSEQGIDVICCTISMFEEVRVWNRDNITNYVEIFLKVSLEVLKKRDQRGLYSGVKKGKISDVAGIDLNIELPMHPDMLIVNDGDSKPEVIVNSIIEKMEIKK